MQRYQHAATSSSLRPWKTRVILVTCALPVHAPALGPGALGDLWALERHRLEGLVPNNVLGHGDLEPVVSAAAIAHTMRFSFSIRRSTQNSARYAVGPHRSARCARWSTATGSCRLVSLQWPKICGMRLVLEQPLASLLDLRHGVLAGMCTAGRTAEPSTAATRAAMPARGGLRCL